MNIQYSGYTPEKITNMNSVLEESGKIYIFGGYSEQGLSSDFFYYDI